MFGRFELEWSQGLKVYLTDITDDDITDDDLKTLTCSEDGELVLAFDPVLQTAKLFLFGVIIEGSYHDDDQDREEDGHSLDPFGWIAFLRITSIFALKKGNDEIEGQWDYGRQFQNDERNIFECVPDESPKRFGRFGRNRVCAERLLSLFDVFVGTR